jgi:hypothetical protein
MTIPVHDFAPTRSEAVPGDALPTRRTREAHAYAREGLGSMDAVWGDYHAAKAGRSWWRLVAVAAVTVALWLTLQAAGVW